MNYSSFKHEVVITISCSSIGIGGTRPFSNIMAPLALFNEGVPAHFCHLMEVPTMRLPNAKILLRWPSRMYNYCSVGFANDAKTLKEKTL